MAMDREDFVDEVRENVKRDVAALSAARIQRWVNWAQQYLADLHTYEEMRISDATSFTTDGDNSLAWPTRMKDLYSMTLQNGSLSEKLKYVNARDFDTVVPRTLTYTEGAPKYYVDFGSTFELFPIPDAKYFLNRRFSQYPIDLATDASTSTLLRKDALISAMSTVFGFWSLREIEDAAYWGTEIVGPLFKASLTGDHSAEDWVPVARGFGNVGHATLTGQWWLSPFTGRTV